MNNKVTHGVGGNEARRGIFSFLSLFNIDISPHFPVDSGLVDALLPGIKSVFLAQYYLQEYYDALEAKVEMLGELQVTLQRTVYFERVDQGIHPFIVTLLAPYIDLSEDVAVRRMQDFTDLFDTFHARLLHFTDNAKSMKESQTFTRIRAMQDALLQMSWVHLGDMDFGQARWEQLLAKTRDICDNEVWGTV